MTVKNGNKLLKIVLDYLFTWKFKKITNKQKQQKYAIAKNPAFGRLQISQLIWIVALIFLFPLASQKGLIAFFCPPPSPTQKN